MIIKRKAPSHIIMKTKRGRLGRVYNLIKRKPHSAKKLAEVTEVDVRTIQNYLLDLQALDLIQPYENEYFPKNPIRFFNSEIALKISLQHSQSLILKNETFKNHDWFNGDITPEIVLDVLLNKEKETYEVSCLEQHLRNDPGYYNQLWKPFQRYKQLMEKLDYPVIPAARAYQQMGFDIEYINAFKRLPEKVQNELVKLHVDVLTAFYRIIVKVKHGGLLAGHCELCPLENVEMNGENL